MEGKKNFLNRLADNRSFCLRIASQYEDYDASGDNSNDNQIEFSLLTRLLSRHWKRHSSPIAQDNSRDCMTGGLERERPMRLGVRCAESEAFSWVFVR